MNTFNNPNASSELQNLETRESNKTTNIVVIVSGLIFLAVIGGIFYFMQQQNVMNMQQQNAENAMTMQQRENLPTQTYESRTIERNNTTTENNTTPESIHIITQPPVTSPTQQEPVTDSSMPTDSPITPSN